MSDKVLTDARLFGPGMRQVRLGQGVPLKHVVDRLDLSKLTITRFEQGGHDIRLSQMIELLDLLGLELVVRQQAESDTSE